MHVHAKCAGNVFHGIYILQLQKQAANPHALHVLYISHSPCSIVIPILPSGMHVYHIISSRPHVASVY